PGEAGNASFEGHLEAKDLWDAEHPRLHRLSVDLLVGGRRVETVTRRVGFREVEVVGTRVLVNGRPIKVKGINRHETHPLLGRSLTPELWRKDAELFRAANINYIRTSHYPPAEEFLDACDEMGLFVECEAPLVWVNHGANDFWKKESPLDPKFRPLILQAVAENVAFNRRHPSIIFWSLANESGWSPHFAAAEAMVKAMDPTRPRTFHDQAYGGYNNLGSAVLPVANFHYPGPQGPDLAVGLNLPRPLFYGEYCHLNTYNRTELAADPGVRDEYGRGFQRMWERMFGSAYVLGGAIWSGIDDVFHLPSGKATGYGEWGPVDGWRREKPEYWHVKKSYSPVKVSPDRVPVSVRGGEISLLIENRHDFTNLKECRVDWRVGDETGQAALDLAPRETGILKIRPKAADLAGKTLRVDVTSPRGFLVDSYEVAIGEIRDAPPPFASVRAGDGSVKLTSDPALFTADGGTFRWTFDRKTGAILEAAAGGGPIVLGGPTLMLLPQTTGPCVTDYGLDIKPFNDTCPDWQAGSVEAKEEAGAVTVTTKGTYAGAEGWHSVRLRGEGQAEFAYEFKVGAKINPRQYGLVVFLPRPFDTLTWSRRGQWTVYPENHIGRPRGTAKALVPGREFKFRTPPSWDWKDDQNELGSNDFRSTKSDLLWAALTSPAGRGLMLVSDGRHAARAFLDKDRVGWLIADFSTGGGDMFFASHHKMDDRPLEPGDVIKGSFALSFVSGKR
ncbi:MAG: glycoside hydrolase family 2, partial [Candidatus Aminicenantes bacterium]|nr:glycoside hydrolase family 2 [Candidatus Aminicenantes bacterium]